MIERRSFLKGLILAPAVIQYGSLMRVVAQPLYIPPVQYVLKNRLGQVVAETPTAMCSLNGKIREIAFNITDHACEAYEVWRSDLDGGALIQFNQASVLSLGDTFKVSIGLSEDFPSSNPKYATRGKTTKLCENILSEILK